MRILVVNPGASSTKIAVFEDEQSLLQRNLQHTAEELAPYSETIDQFDFRRNVILSTLEEARQPLEFDAVIGRGGLTNPLVGGVYAVNDRLLEDTLHSKRQHPCNLGAVIARQLAEQMPGCRAFTADPVVVDEMIPEARVTGFPDIERQSIWHALNQKAVARRFAREHGKRYEDLRLIVCHLGSGTTVAAHCYGRTVDVNNGFDGDGPFSVFRSGGLPAAEIVRMCFAEGATLKSVNDYIKSASGVFAHLGTGDMREVMRRVEAGDELARLIVKAMVYHTSKEIAALGATLEGRVDAILLTGGICYVEHVTSLIRQHVGFLAPVHIYPGEDEMQALAENALRALRGECEIMEYQ